MEASISEKIQQQSDSMVSLNYEPSEFPRELARHYISASENDISEMLHFIGLQNIQELFHHIPESLHFEEGINVPDELNYEKTAIKLAHIAARTKLKTSFIGDGLPHWKTHPIQMFAVCGSLGVSCGILGGSGIAFGRVGRN